MQRSEAARTSWLSKISACLLSAPSAQSNGLIQLGPSQLGTQSAEVQSAGESVSWGLSWAAGTPADAP